MTLRRSGPTMVAALAVLALALPVNLAVSKKKPAKKKVTPVAKVSGKFVGARIPAVKDWNTGKKITDDVQITVRKGKVTKLFLRYRVLCGAPGEVTPESTSFKLPVKIKANGKLTATGVHVHKYANSTLTAKHTLHGQLNAKRNKFTGHYTASGALVYESNPNNPDKCELYPKKKQKFSASKR